MHPSYTSNRASYSVNEVEYERARDLAVRVRDRRVLGVAERRQRDGAFEDVGTAPGSSVGWRAGSYIWQGTPGVEYGGAQEREGLTSECPGPYPSEGP